MPLKVGESVSGLCSDASGVGVVGMDSQKALDALRFSIDVQGDKSVKVEEDLDAGVVAELRARGHDVTVARAYDRVGFGGGQVVSRDAETGVLCAGTEPRKDGAALGW